MQARRLTIKPYEVILAGSDEPQPFRVCESIVELLFNPTLQLDKSEAVKADLLAQKLLAHASGGADDILLEIAEYDRIVAAVNAHKGWPRQAIPIIHLVDSAELVDVTEAPN